MILIVDDNQENIFSLKSLLIHNNFEVDSASSGEEALKKILKRPYALIILDVQMPEMDGFEVAEAVTSYSKSKDIPIIFLSAVNTHKKFVAKGYTSGGVDYVTKPFDPDILLLKVKTFYRLSEQTRQLNEMEKSLRQEIELRKQAEQYLEKKVKERTQELIKSNSRLEQSNRELQQFAFVASHDLQEPLRKIQVFSNIALEKHIDDKEKLTSFLTKMSDSATRLRNLIADLLNYSKIYMEDTFLPTDLRILVEEVVSDLEFEVQRKNCKVHISDLPKIEGIPYQLRQLFQNLISNAVKFSRESADSVITVEGETIAEKSFTAPANRDGKYCRISVADNGIGFDNEYSMRIFEIFQRLNTRASYDGTGIGLAIVKKVVERHDGLIQATGKENEGARFTFILPLRHQTAGKLI